jgi:hypothetical protein
MEQNYSNLQLEKQKKNSSTIFPIFLLSTKTKKGPKTIVPKKNTCECVCVCVCVVCVSHLLHSFLEFGLGVFFGLVWFGLVWFVVVKKENCENIYTFLTIIVKF